MQLRLRPERLKRTPRRMPYIAQAHGVDTMFTLSGASSRCTTEPYTADPPMKILDVRQEHTATFAGRDHGRSPETGLGRVDRARA
ncbi:MAG: hypothetical protein R2709_11830 [Marmoricola sp.]